ncbi:hypothetical protein LY78DRAFT_382847 [Colletotrichum sublineola]|nr:hypothetical protein LY78DRAFT_382847 [Colletotrichum sublineola]
MLDCNLVLGLPNRSLRQRSMGEAALFGREASSGCILCNVFTSKSKDDRRQPRCAIDGRYSCRCQPALFYYPQTQVISVAPNSCSASVKFTWSLDLSFQPSANSRCCLLSSPVPRKGHRPRLVWRQSMRAFARNDCGDQQRCLLRPDTHHSLRNMRGNSLPIGAAKLRTGKPYARTGTLFLPRREALRT